MSKHLRIWLFAILGTLLASTTLLAQGVITMTTSKRVGETILLKVVANDNVSIEGALENGEMSEDGFKFYTTKSQTITIRGDVTELDCNENQLTCLNVSKNTALKLLDCSWNQLTSLNVSKNTALKVLECSGNQLTSLNISGCARLRIIACDSNYIKGKAMTKLVNSLPNRRGMYCGIIYLVDRSSKKKDKNSCSDADVTISEKKNWRVL